MEQRHIEIQARELRDGDLIRLGPSSGNYVLVADAFEQGGLIRVAVYDGMKPEPAWSLAYAPEETVTIREDRNLKPVA